MFTDCSHPYASLNNMSLTLNFVFYFVKICICFSINNRSHIKHYNLFFFVSDVQTCISSLVFSFLMNHNNFNLHFELEKY